jgi:hypothetical protein
MTQTNTNQADPYYQEYTYSLQPGWMMICPNCQFAVARIVREPSQTPEPPAAIATPPEAPRSPKKATLEMRTAIEAFLAQHPGAKGTEVIAAVGGKSSSVYALLREIKKEGTISAAVLASAHVVEANSVMSSEELDIIEPDYYDFSDQH